MNDSPPNAPKKGLPTIAKVGIGCGVLLVIVLAIGGLLVAKSVPMLKEFAEESQKTPVAATAKLMVKVMPGMELVKADEVTKEITIKNTKTGETMTMTLDELKQGKFKKTDANGNETIVDTKNGTTTQTKVKSAEPAPVVPPPTPAPAK